MQTFILTNEESAALKEACQPRATFQFGAVCFEPDYDAVNKGWREIADGRGVDPFSICHVTQDSFDAEPNPPDKLAK